MILLLDNFDSFTYNLVDYIKKAGVEAKIFRNNESLESVIANSYTGVLLSPGPGIPKNSGILLEIIEYYKNLLPILGICLGHQALGEYFGAQLVKAQKPMHGKLSRIQIKKDPIFLNIKNNIKVVRYHSLVLNNLPDCLESIAESEIGEIMAIRHINYNIRGLQFHPEAVLTQYGYYMLFNWIKTNSIK